MNYFPPASSTRCCAGRMAGGSRCRAPSSRKRFVDGRAPDPAALAAAHLKWQWLTAQWPTTQGWAGAPGPGGGGLRQSSRQQVLEHSESTPLQYALAERAAALGWARSRIVVIDDDLGVSAATADARAGFARLVTEVTMGRVGIVLGIEMSRLARTGLDWQVAARCRSPNTTSKMSITSSRALAASGGCGRPASRSAAAVPDRPAGWPRPGRFSGPRPLPARSARPTGPARRCPGPEPALAGPTRAPARRWWA